MDSPGTQPLRNYLQQLGIEIPATDAYIALHRLGPASAQQLAKATGASRTQTYRHLEALQHQSLVSSEQLSYGTLFRALPIENVEAAIVEKENAAANLKQELGAMSTLLETLAGGAGPKATTQHFYGIAGLKQVNWNLTKADKEFRVLEVAHLSDHFDKTFTTRCRERYIERQLTSFDLTNATTVTAAEIEPYAPGRAFFRHLDRTILTINFEVYIYNDVVTLLDYAKENAHAIEIHHPTLSKLMFQMFEAMWGLGEPLEIEQ